jgi:hypothetical protein
MTFYQLSPFSHNSQQGERKLLFDIVTLIIKTSPDALMFQIEKIVMAPLTLLVPGIIQVPLNKAFLQHF